MKSFLQGLDKNPIRRYDADTMTTDRRHLARLIPAERGCGETALSILILVVVL